MFRAVLFTDIDGSPFVIRSLPVKEWETAEKILDNGVESGFATGGHTEIRVQINGLGKQWYLCNEKPELV